MAGAYSPYASGTLAPVKAEAEAGSGGGAPSELCPRIYDIVLPYDERQAEVLSSYDRASWTMAVVTLRYTRSKGMKAKLPSAILAAAKAEMEEEARSLKENARGDEEKRLRSADPRTRAIALFDLGRSGDARSAFGALLSAAPEDPIALAYSASLRAMEAGESKTRPRPSSSCRKPSRRSTGPSPPRKGCLPDPRPERPSSRPSSAEPRCVPRCPKRCRRELGRGGRLPQGRGIGCGSGQ